MWRVDPRCFRGVTALAAITALAVLAGASPAKKKRPEPPPPKVEETIADLAYIVSSSEVKLEGVGLVVGLDDAGVEPPPSIYRSRLVDEMRKAGVDKPNELLKNPKVTMVIVKLKLPVGVSPSDRLDVDIELPPASGTRSLAGGYLLQTRLREVMVLGGVPKEGQDAALAQGPVMTGNLAKPDDVKVGRVLGGGRVKKEIPYHLVLKETRRSFRTSALAESVVNQRFPQTEGVDQKGSATAKTDQYLVLKVPRVYHQNQDRFFRVVKLLPLVDNPNLRAQRMALWGQELLDPTKTGIAALRLEGLGVSATETLKTGLASPNAQVRFFAAEALAYLGEPAGADALAESVVQFPQFRAHALAALASTDQSAFHLKLRKLMDTPDVEVRYGAFNALRILASDDYFLGQIRVLDDPPSDDPAETEMPDNLAAAINASAHRKPRQDDPFALYVVECEGPPMVHVARTRRCEVVIFGRGLKFQTPIVLGVGSLQLNASDGDESVEISRIVPSRFKDADRKVSSTLDLADVLRRTAGLGASYPEIVTILQAADHQRNLPGPLVVDAVPSAKPEYLAAAFLGQDTTAKKDPALLQTKATAPPPRRRFFGLFNHATPPATDTAATRPAAPLPPAPRSAADFVAPGGTTPTTDSVAPGSPSPKKDDAVVPSSATTPTDPPKSRSFLDWLRGRSSSDN
jgi:hypothetical protein